MIRRLVMFLMIFTAILFSATVALSVHEPIKGTITGTITKIEPIEYEVTVKDEKGKEVKIKVKDLAGTKVGDSVVIQDGKMKKAVKPITGGY